MPITPAITKATELFNSSELFSGSDFSESAELGFSLSVVISSLRGILTVQVLDQAIGGSLYPNGVLVNAVYVMPTGGRVSHPFQEKMEINTLEVSKLSCKSLDDIEVAYAQLAIGAEVLVIMFEKLRTLNE
ncbi:hypothetical protein OTK49_20860 [Vibrio coralliirubri]|uniref:hypothetical protein n=1 Tax=Vibrio coralliirubri TaxID=1516159 RepID=UPI002284DD69|nr:hypothetical protein [Vibrio coralliirubri]MCY9864970.1 hypothetical protein [Vibrio coralliirubri]